MRLMEGLLGDISWCFGVSWSVCVCSCATAFFFVFETKKQSNPVQIPIIFFKTKKGCATQKLNFLHGA